MLFVELIKIGNLGIFFFLCCHWLSVRLIIKTLTLCVERWLTNYQQFPLLIDASPFFDLHSAHMQKQQFFKWKRVKVYIQSLFFRFRLLTFYYRHTSLILIFRRKENFAKAFWFPFVSFFFLFVLIDSPYPNEFMFLKNYTWLTRTGYVQPELKEKLVSKSRKKTIKLINKNAAFACIGSQFSWVFTPDDVLAADKHTYIVLMSPHVR